MLKIFLSDNKLILNDNPRKSPRMDKIYTSPKILQTSNELLEYSAKYLRYTIIVTYNTDQQFHTGYPQEDGPSQV